MFNKSLLLFSVAIIWLSHFLIDAMLGIWPVYKTLAGLDLATAGLISGLCAFIGEGLQVVSGSLSDMGYRKHLIFGGLLASIAGAFFAYAGTSYLGLFLLYLVICIGSGAFHPAAASFVSDLPTTNKSLMVALFTSGGAFGMAISQLMFTQAHFWFDGQVIWLAAPAICVVLIAVFSRIARQEPSRPRESKQSHFDLSIFVKFFKHSPLRFLYFSQVCSSTMFWGTLFLLPDLLSSRGYESWIAFGGGHLCFVLGGALMMIPAGYLADYYSSRSVILGATTIAMILFYFMLANPFLGDWTILLLLFLIGALLGAINPVTVAFGTDLAPNHKGLVSAFLMGLVWCVSEAIGQIGGGFLAANFIDDAPAKALAVMGVIFLFGIAIALQLPRKVEEPALFRVADIVA